MPGDLKEEEEGLGAVLAAPPSPGVQQLLQAGSGFLATAPRGPFCQERVGSSAQRPPLGLGVGILS